MKAKATMITRALILMVCVTIIPFSLHIMAYELGEHKRDTMAVKDRVMEGF